jgi:hypothetical protein
VSHADGDVVQAVKDATDGAGVDIVVRRSRRTGSACSPLIGGPNRRLRSDVRPASPPGLIDSGGSSWSSIVDDGDAASIGVPTSSSGTGRARIHVDSIFPLAAAAEAHERLESVAQFGKVILTIPD